MNAQLAMDFTILAKQRIMNYKILDMDFYLTMCLCNVCETLGYKYLKFRTLKVHLVNETLS
jgi:hypothetical protein